MGVKREKTMAESRRYETRLEASSTETKANSEERILLLRR